MGGWAAAENLQGGYGSAVVVQIERHEADRGVRLADPFGGRVTHVAEHQFGAGQLPAPPVHVHPVEAGPPDVRQVAIVHRGGHASAAVEAEHIDA